MSKQREALQMALDAFENVFGKGKRCNAAIAAIKEALAEQPEPKPVVWIRHENEWVGLAPKERLPINTPRPDARKPLTDEQISAIVQSMSAYTWDAHMLARAIERAHGVTE